MLKRVGCAASHGPFSRRLAVRAFPLVSWNTTPRPLPLAAGLTLGVVCFCSLAVARFLSPELQQAHESFMGTSGFGARMCLCIKWVRMYSIYIHIHMCIYTCIGI